MPRETIEGLSEKEKIHCKEWADTLLHNAPQTKDFFDKNISLSEIKNRQEQKEEARDLGKSLRADETSKYFIRSNATTINKSLRPQLEIIMRFGYQNGASDTDQALSPKMMLKYVQFREKQVYERTLTPDSFKAIMSKIRIFGHMSTATKGFPNVDYQKMTDKATKRVNEYIKAHKATDNPVNNDRHKIHAFTNGEEQKIIQGVKNEKVKVALELIDKHLFRIENASMVYLGYKWEKIYGKWERVKTDEPKIALVSKGTQRHTVTLEQELFNKLMKFSEKRKGYDVFHVSKRTIQNNVKKSAEALGIKSTVHNLRATAAYKLYNKSLNADYSESEAKKIVSNKLFHGRLDITSYYINSAKK